MTLTGLHLLLTYTCNYACDHCFVWGSPDQRGAFTVEMLEEVFKQAREAESIETFFFEGGEPFLYYPILQHGITRASELGLWTGVVSNGYWAEDFKLALDLLRPLAAAGLDHISLSSDEFHMGLIQGEDDHPGVRAAQQLGIGADVIYIDPPVAIRDPEAFEAGKIVTGGGVMFRGRAAEMLTEELPRQRWSAFNTCPYESLEDPERVHLDSYGNLHLCQGILMGNLLEKPLKQIVAEYRPMNHPVVGPLLAGGPAQLARSFHLETQPDYVDACHLCFDARKSLKPHLPKVLGPAEMYGVPAQQEGLP